MNLTYTIADLHGSFDLLELALAAIEQHAGRQEAGTRTLVTLGDYIDRGPQSRQVIERLIAGPPDGWRWICLKGNHEEIMLQTLSKPLNPDWWIGNGGGSTLISYGHAREGPYTPEVVPVEHLDWLEALPLMHVDQHRVFVHAGVDPDLPLDNQDAEQLIWKLYERSDARGHGDRHVVHGHEQFEYGPVVLAGRTDLDTFAWRTGRLVVGVLNDDKAGSAIDVLEVLREGWNSKKRERRPRPKPGAPSRIFRRPSRPARAKRPYGGFTPSLTTSGNATGNRQSPRSPG